MPAVTRRQSGKLSQLRDAVSSAPQNDEDDFMDGDLSDWELVKVDTTRIAVGKDTKIDISELGDYSNDDEEKEEGVEEDDENFEEEDDGEDEYTASGMH